MKNNLKCLLFFFLISSAPIIKAAIVSIQNNLIYKDKFTDLNMIAFDQEGIKCSDLIQIPYGDIYLHKTGTNYSCKSLGIMYLFNKNHDDPYQGGIRLYCDIKPSQSIQVLIYPRNNPIYDSDGRLAKPGFLNYKTPHYGNCAL